MRDAPSYEFLFATWEGGGNVPPALTVARKLLQNGHRVRVMSDRCNRAEVESIGAGFTPWHRAPSRQDKSAATDILRDWEASTPREVFARLRDNLMCGPALEYAFDVVDEIDRHRPDLVVSSEMLLGVMAACEATRVPLVLLAANLSLFPIPGVPPFGAGLTPARTVAERQLHQAIAASTHEMFSAGLPAVNRARRALGLPPVSDLLHQFRAADRLLLATSEIFDFPADHLPEQIRYVGPQLDEVAWADSWVSPWHPEDERPLVLVAFSTTFQDQSATIQRVVDAVADLPVRTVVTLGPNLGEEAVRPGSENIVVRRSVPHGAIMRNADLVVTHAGHGTVMRALSHRVPLLCMPMGRDQNDNTARVVSYGAGLGLSPQAPIAEIRHAIGCLLEEPSFRRAARRLGDAVAMEMESSPVVPELTTLAARAAHGRIETAAA
jgi:MGT family glycosyltransferase